MTYTYIRFNAEHGVATLRFNRPEKLNSFNREMLDEFRSALEVIKVDNTIRCLLITGEGRGFCAGQDLSERVVGGQVVVPDLKQSLDERYNPIVRSMVTLPVPVLCAVNGVAAGAGVNVALAGDIVIAARSASFIQAFCKIGLIPDAGGTWQLLRLVGRARAMGLALLGDRLSAEQAEQWGMIWRVYDDAEFMAEANSLAQRLAAQPTQALGLIKRAMNASAGHTLDQQLDLERDLQELASQSEDYLEGVQAFVEKRAPVFTGR